MVYSHVALPYSEVFIENTESVYSPIKLHVYICCRKTPGTIDVIGGQTATISRVEGRRRHNLEGNNIQVIHIIWVTTTRRSCISTLFYSGPTYHLLSQISPSSQINDTQSCRSVLKKQNDHPNTFPYQSDCS